VVVFTNVVQLEVAELNVVTRGPLLDMTCEGVFFFIPSP